MNEVVDKVKELTTRLDKGVEEILTSDRYRAYLKQMSKFHSYSFRNSLLILLQNENATLVAGYKTWQNEFNRQVNKGEKGIQIFAPCPYKVKKETEFTNEKGEKEKKVEEVLIPKFKAVTVFDVSQTTGEPLKEIAEELKGEYKDFSKLFEAIKKCSDFEITFKPGTEEKGSCSIKERRITIKEGMSENHTIKTLIHEIAHEKLHAEPAENVSANQKEIEAESVAFVVANYFGIDTSSYSFDYISTWQDKEKAEVKNLLNTIQETSNMLIESIKKNLSLEREISISDRIKGAKEKAENQPKSQNKEKSKKKNISL